MKDEFMETCEYLTNLAMIKNHKIDEKSIVAISKFLLRDFKPSDIYGACAHFARRLERFPDLAHFYNLIAPMRSTEEIAEREIGSLIQLLGQGYNDAIDKMTDIQKDLLTVWSWSELTRCKESDLSKIRVNMTFYLRNRINSMPNVKISESLQAIKESQGLTLIKEK